MRHPAQKQYFLKIALPTILTAVLLVAATRLILAQTTPQRSIVISPPTAEHTLNPGERTEGILKLTNSGPTALTFKAGLHDFIVEDKAGTPTILSKDTLDNKYSGASWIGVTPSTFEVAPGETQELSYFVQVPADAAPGGRYATVIYEPLDFIQVDGTGAGVNTQLGSLIYITVAGPITESAEVVEFTAPGFSEYAPITVTTEIQNNSDIHVKPKGSITIKNMFGQEVARTELAEKNIFPEVSYIHTNTFFSDGFKVGRYTAELDALYGTNSNLPLTATVSFIIFPWKIALGITLVIAIIIVALLLFRRRREQKTHHEETMNPPAHQS